MALTLNGSNNTIAGVAVGGLPDGIVDTDMLAANAVTAVKRGAGAILQVVHGSYSTEVSTTGTSFVDTGLSQAITPLKTGSQFLVLISQHISIIRANDGQGGGIKLLQDSTARLTPGQNWQTYILAQGVSNVSWRGNIYLSSKHAHGISAGTSTTYKTQMQLHTDSNSGSVKAQFGTNESMITIMEIA